LATKTNRQALSFAHRGLQRFTGDSFRTQFARSRGCGCRIPGRIPVAKSRSRGADDLIDKPSQINRLRMKFETEHGRAGHAEFRSPNKFRLTYRPTENAQSTDDWRRVKTVKDARNLAYDARRRVSKKQNSSGGKRHLSVGKSHPENGTVPVGEIPTPAIPEIPPRLSISRGGAYATNQSGSRSAPVGSAVASEPLRESMIDTIVKLHRCSRTEAATILESLPSAQPRGNPHSSPSGARESPSSR
jgi:hypothetical protein